MRAASEDALRRELAELAEKHQNTAHALAVAREALAGEREARENAEEEAADEARKRADLEAQLAAALVESKLTDERCRREADAATAAYSARDEAVARARETEGVLRACEERKEKAEGDLAAARTELAEQLRVNGVLMQRKEQVEWDLLKAMASGYSGVSEGVKTEIAAARASEGIGAREAGRGSGRGGRGAGRAGGRGGRGGGRGRGGRGNNGGARASSNPDDAVPSEAGGTFAEESDDEISCCR